MHKPSVVSAVMPWKCADHGHRPEKGAFDRSVSDPKAWRPPVPKFCAASAAALTRRLSSSSDPPFPAESRAPSDRTACFARPSTAGPQASSFTLRPDRRNRRLIGPAMVLAHPLLRPCGNGSDPSRRFDAQAFARQRIPPRMELPAAGRFGSPAGLLLSPSGQVNA